MSELGEREPLLDAGVSRQVAHHAKQFDPAFHDPVDGAAFHAGENGI